MADPMKTMGRGAPSIGTLSEEQRAGAAAPVQEIFIENPPAQLTSRSQGSSGFGEDEMMASKATVEDQYRIVRELNYPVRLLGVALGFCTMVFVWETADYIVKVQCSKKIEKLYVYLIMAFGSVGALFVSHYVTRMKALLGTLHGSVLYAYSTLALAISTWGVIDTGVQVLVPARLQHLVWAFGALFFTVVSLIYLQHTRHNALLDIMSCAGSLGLMDPHEEAEMEPIRGYLRRLSVYGAGGGCASVPPSSARSTGGAPTTGSGPLSERGPARGGALADPAGPPRRGAQQGCDSRA